MDRGVQCAWEGKMPAQFILIVFYVLLLNRQMLKP
jgi:hypothetical protein